MATIQDRVSRLEGAQEHGASKADLAEATGELKVEMANSKGELKVDVAESKGELKAEMRAMELRITLWLGGLMIGIAGVMVAIIVAERYFLS